MEEILARLGRKQSTMPTVIPFRTLQHVETQTSFRPWVGDRGSGRRKGPSAVGHTDAFMELLLVATRFGRFERHQRRQQRRLLADSRYCTQNQTWLPLPRPPLACTHAQTQP